MLFSKVLSEESIRLAKELGKDFLRVPLIKEQVWPIVSGIIAREEAIDPLELELRRAEGLIVDKQFAVALEAIKKATVTAHPNAKSLALSGERYAGLGDPEKAEKSLESSLQEQQNYYPAVRLLGIVYSQRGQHQKAIDLLGSMAAASPLNLKTMLTLGTAYSAADQLKKAREILERLRTIDGENQQVSLELGKIAFKEGKKDEAETLFAEAEDAAEIGRFFNNYAIGLVCRGDTTQAVASYETAMRILRERAPEKMIFLQYNLGLALKKRGDLSLSFALLAECCVADPNYKRAHDSLDGLIVKMRKDGIALDKGVLARVIAARKSSA